jgi:hypothetical protein
MKIKNQKDFLSGLLFLAVGLAFAWAALDYKFGSSASPGPAFFPFGLGLVLALLGAVVLLKSLTIETADGEPVGRLAWRPLLVILAGVLAFGVALPRFGLVVAMPLLVILSSLASKEFTWLSTLLNAAVLTVLCWGVFVAGLGLRIPLWPQ